MYPSYLSLLENGELQKRLALLKAHYHHCQLCPHTCGVNRVEGEFGICKSGPTPVVASYNVHHGEEPPISGTRGSGTIFLSGCSGRCIFCQNYPISQIGTGSVENEERLADMMLDLQVRGCHNINLVTPTHFLPSIVGALLISAAKGLMIPLVYNTGGYERVEILRLLKGIVDIYLPDAKYGNNENAKDLSGFKNYVTYNRAALREMYRQVGNLIIENGIAKKGLLVRHLILPENISGTVDVMKFLSEDISPDVYVSLMDQYFPAYKALQHASLSRRITKSEYTNAINSFYVRRLHRGWIQNHIS